MKVIKRDGRVVDYDKSKIRIAIEKANKEVGKKEKATATDIKTIIEYIEELDKKRILVEDIQDIIEEKLMELGKYELAKKYIVYRYTRALIRKSNTTDASILGLIRNGNKLTSSNNLPINITAQRNLIAGEVSKDLTKRILLPEKIRKAWEEGILYFHDAEYFIQPMINTCSINIEDMLDNGTVINGTMLEKPKSFQVACAIIPQIIATVASNQYGMLYVDISFLGKYLSTNKEKIKRGLEEELKDNKVIENIANKRIEKELIAGIQNIQYRINTLITTNGSSPSIAFFLNLRDDEYIEENARIFEEILKQRYEGIKNADGESIIPEFPKIIYALNEMNCLNGNKYDFLTELAIKCSMKKIEINYVSKPKFEKGFNQGIVSINLPQIAIIAEGDEEKFWNLLEERLELCKEALMCRHYALLGTVSDISPIHWKDGAISRLKTGEKIDSLLYGKNSTLSLGYIGIYEMTKLMKGKSHAQPEGRSFAIKVMKFLKDKISKWRKETDIEFSLYGDEMEWLGKELLHIDKEKYGTIEGITDKERYTNSYHVDSSEEIDVYDRLKLEIEFQKISIDGNIVYVGLEEINNSTEELKKIIKFAYQNIEYLAIK